MASSDLKRFSAHALTERVDGNDDDDDIVFCGEVINQSSKVNQSITVAPIAVVTKRRFQRPSDAIVVEEKEETVGIAKAVAPEPVIKLEPAPEDKYRCGGVIIRKDFSSFFNRSLVVPKEGSFGQKAVMDLLFRETHDTCPETCMCKLQQRRNRALVKEIINHKWHGGKLFLLCKLHSAKSVPEYLRVCQVNCELRGQYGRYLKLNGRPPSAKEKWSVEHDIAAREALCKDYPFSADNERVQQQIPHYIDTLDWMEKTGNGKVKRTSLPFVAKPKLRVTARPGPVIHTVENAFWEVERIVGSSRDPAGIRIYFVKWLGYPPHECTWEPETNLQMSHDAIVDFNLTHGEPTTEKPIVYSSEGNECAVAYAKYIQSAKRK
ncbi:hypothetical protein BV898_11152 [Hypsibius exemplaris]|uniref:Chromo domain-containing protein n=1 Tax=Hypsibius exemplaris TaxID=2072580 RepID=A0A1W0WHH0_HYPEX|nr:hypothetical protein BV898_11152 [Hypsibius exemplaris]